MRKSAEQTRKDLEATSLHVISLLKERERTCLNLIRLYTKELDRIRAALNGLSKAESDEHSC